MVAMKPMFREVAGLRVALVGGSDGSGGGEGPLVVLLHGFGAPGTDLLPLAQYLPAPAGTRFAFPAAPLSLSGGFDIGLEDFESADSRAWWMIDLARMQRRLGDFSAFTEDVPEGLEPARQRLDVVLDELEKTLRVPPGQLVLGGFSQGAILSLHTALHGARKLAGLVLMSGTLINEKNWLQALPGRPALPVMQSHGRQDMLLPFGLAEKLCSHLRGAGWAIDFVPFSGGHEIPPPVLKAASKLLHQVLQTKE